MNLFNFQINQDKELNQELESYNQESIKKIKERVISMRKKLGENGKCKKKLKEIAAGEEIHIKSIKFFGPGLRSSAFINMLSSFGFPNLYASCHHNNPNNIATLILPALLTKKAMNESKKVKVFVESIIEGAEKKAYDLETPEQQIIYKILTSES